MTMNLAVLNTAPRVLIEAALKPIAGTRIQPTGFPDLGPAMYEDANKVPTLLVESAQSMANRLEAVCWDEAADNITPELKGLPFVKVVLAGLGDGTDTTCSLLEFHRLNSPYIMSGMTAGGSAFDTVLKGELRLAPSAQDGGAGENGEEVAGVVNLRRLATVCFKYDPNSLIHGVFLEKIAGRLRHPRALSAFIEATEVGRVDSGGVKFDRALPAKKKAAEVIGIAENEVAKRGYANVPFHRTEFTAKEIKAYFSLDLSQLRGYGLPADATELLTILSLWKVRKFLDSNMRLRSACELELPDGEKSIAVRRPPTGFTLPSASELTEHVQQLIRACKPLFPDPSVTLLTWNPKASGAQQVVIELPLDFPTPKPFGDSLKPVLEFKKKTAKTPAKLVLKKGISDQVVQQIENHLGADNPVTKAVKAKRDEGTEPSSLPEEA